MQPIPRPVCLFASALLTVISLGLTACGSSRSRTANRSNISQRQAEYPPRVTAPANAKRGGTLTVIANSDVDNIDPGVAYAQPTFMLDLAADSPLMGWPANDTAAPVPLLAADQPVISNGGKTVTFHIKTNVKYSPPTGGGAGWNEPVVSQDVKYAIERGLMPGVPNGYLSLYFCRSEGARRGRGCGQDGPDQSAEHQRDHHAEHIDSRPGTWRWPSPI